MPQSRWVQRILIQADKLGIKTDWWKKVEEAENRFEISHKDYLQKNWKKIVRSKWRRWEEIEWRRKCKESWALRYYNKEALGERAWQVDGTDIGGMITRFKIGDLSRWESNTRMCPVCKESVESIIKHVVKECSVIQKEIIEEGRFKVIESEREIQYLIDHMNRNNWNMVVMIMKRVIEAEHQHRNGK